MNLPALGSRSPNLLPALVSGAVALFAGIFALSAGAGLTGSWRAGLIIAAVATAAAAWLAWRRPVLPLDRGAASRALLVLSGTATVAALIQNARLAVFMIAPTAVGYSAVPSSDWEVRHSCLSAYYVAAQAVDQGANVYDSGLYSLPADKAGDKRKPRLLGPFRVDVYEYPPPFLLLPRALAVVAPDFPRFRPLWFGLTGAVVMLAMLFTARQLGPVAGTRALLLSPLLWAAVPSLSVLQKGNVQGMIIALAMAAMLLFQRRHFAAGGLLLAYATASKLFPGLLLVYLLARRQWLALAWTAGASAVLVSLTWLVLGWPPFAHFLDHLPGLVGGEAFPAFQNPAAIAINYSLPGLVFKVGLFGVPGTSFGAAKVVGWIYTFVAVAVTVLVARQKVPNADQPVIWLAILSVATLRSPFLPQAYAGFCTLWLLTLLAATAQPSVRTLGLIIATWLALNIFWPLDWTIDPRLLAAVTTVPQAVTIAVAVLALRRHWRSEPGAPQTNRSGGHLVVPATTA